MTDSTFTPQELRRIKRLLIKRQLSVELGGLLTHTNFVSSNTTPSSKSRSKSNKQAAEDIVSTPNRFSQADFVKNCPLLSFAFTHVLSSCPVWSDQNTDFWDHAQQLALKVSGSNLGWAGDAKNPTQTATKQFSRILTRILNGMICTPYDQTSPDDSPMTTRASSSQDDQDCTIVSQALGARVIIARENKADGKNTAELSFICHVYGQDYSKLVEHTYDTLSTLHDELKSKLGNEDVVTIPKKPKSGFFTTRSKQTKSKKVQKFIQQVLIISSTQCDTIRESVTNLLLADAFSPTLTSASTEDRALLEVYETWYQEQHTSMFKFRERKRDLEEELKVAGCNILQDITSSPTEEPMDKLRKIFKAAPLSTDLPEIYQDAMDVVARQVASTLAYDLCFCNSASSNLKSFQRLYSLTPFTAIGVISRISNPVSMASLMVDLFLARPFGAHSLLQRTVKSALTEEHEANKEKLDQLKQSIPPLLWNELQRCADDYEANPGSSASMHDSAREWLQASLRDRQSNEGTSTDPLVIAKFLDALSPSQVDNLQEALLIMCLKKDEAKLVELLGDNHLAKMLKSLLSTALVPISELYEAISLPTAMGGLKDFMKDLLAVCHIYEDKFSPKALLSRRANIADVGDWDEQSSIVINNITNLVQRYRESLYSSLREVILNQQKTGHLSKLIEWFVSKVVPVLTGSLPSNSKIVLDLPSLVQSAVNEQDFQVMKVKLGQQKSSVDLIPPKLHAAFRTSFVANVPDQKNDLEEVAEQG